MEDIKKSGLYIVSDEFFKKYPNKRYMDNKGENRPHYYAIADKAGILWLIPLSSRVEKYKRLIQENEARHGAGKCVHYVVAPIYGKERAFIICDMFPVLPKYILRAYKVNNTPYILQNKNIRKNIEEKANAYLNMVERGVLHSPLNIMNVKKKLLGELGAGMGSRRPC